MVGQGWLFQALRRAATATIWGELPWELALPQSTQPASNSHSREPPAWTVVHRARGPWGCRAQRRVERANGVLSGRIWGSASGLPLRFLQPAGDSLRPLCERLQESKFDMVWVTFWKLCVITLTRSK